MENPIIDEEHNNGNVGNAPVLQIDDIGLLTGAHVSDDSAWDKVKDGTYKGFSLGGDILAVREYVEEGRLECDLTEIVIDRISLCDRPVCPGAVYQFVTNQGGSLVLCINKGGENKVADQNTDQTQEQEANKGLIAQFVEWIKGEGKDEMTAALGIDMSNYATKEDLVGINDNVSGISTKLDEFMAKLDKAAGEGQETGSQAAGEAAPQNSGDGTKVVTELFAQFGEGLKSVVDTMKDVSERVNALEESRGMRKSVDAVGGKGEGEGIFDSLFPAGMAAASE
jgi:hypothetical protein